MEEFLFLILVLLVCSCQYDLIITGGKIFDSEKKEWSSGKSIYIQGSTIVDIVETPANMPDAKRLIDIANLNGYRISPGFIDGHTHSDITIPRFPHADSFVSQGVTTQVTGNCGFSMGPFKNEEEFEDINKNYRKLIGFNKYLNESHIEDKFYQYVEKHLSKKGTSVVPLVGYGAIRNMVVQEKPGDEITTDEMNELKAILTNEMKNGIKGLSIGLYYRPMKYASVLELIEMGKIIKQYNGVFTFHMRSEGETLIESINEVREIAKESGCRCIISHFKAEIPVNWHKQREAIDIVVRSQNEGIDLMYDVYPYNAYRCSAYYVFPPWSQTDGVNGLIDLLNIPEKREIIMNDILGINVTEKFENMFEGITWDKVLISGISDDDYDGKTPQQAADVMNNKLGTNYSPLEAFIEIYVKENGVMSVIVEAMSNENVDLLITNETSSIISDGRSVSLEHESIGSVHPRWYGSFPRLLGVYVRERKVLSLEDALHKITYVPAKRFNIPSRGNIKKGYVADITIFDKDNVIDVANFTHSHQYSKGIKYVLVNGELVFDDEKFTFANPGTVVFGKVEEIDKHDNVGAIVGAVLSIFFGIGLILLILVVIVVVIVGIFLFLKSRNTIKNETEMSTV